MIVLDSLVYKPGSTLTGRVYVRIVKQTKFSGVYLKVSGMERVRFVEKHTVRGTRGTRGTGGPPRRLTITYIGTNTLIKADTTLIDGGEFKQGEYTFPFMLQLPTGLPGSMELNGGLLSDGTSASISYQVKAVVRIPGFLKSDLRNISPFAIVQAPPNFETSNFVASSESDVRILGCMHRGRAELMLNSPTDSFYTGGLVSVNVSAKNTSKSSIKLVVELRRSLHLSTTQAIRYTETVIAKGFGPTVPANSSVENVNVTFQVPANASQQCFGFMVKCLYSLRLVGKVSWGRDVHCTVPAFVYHPYAENPPTIVADVSQMMTDGITTLTLSSPAAIPPPITIEDYRAESFKRA